MLGNIVRNTVRISIVMWNKRDLAGDIHFKILASFLYRNHRRFLSRTRNRREESRDLSARIISITEEHSQRAPGRVEIEHDNVQCHDITISRMIYNIIYITIKHLRFTACGRETKTERRALIVRDYCHRGRCCTRHPILWFAYATWSIHQSSTAITR